MLDSLLELSELHHLLVPPPRLSLSPLVAPLVVYLLGRLLLLLLLYVAGLSDGLEVLLLVVDGALVSEDVEGVGADVFEVLSQVLGDFFGLDLRKFDQTSKIRYYPSQLGRWYSQHTTL